MRFFENGPDIPDRLINDRNRGSVVFFCGAGVSMPVLPSFYGLAQKVVGALRADPTRVDAAPSLDQLFGDLYREYGSVAIEEALYRFLRPPRQAVLDQHRILLALSRGSDGQPQLVSTNFDTLFERAEPGLRRYEPPALPALVHGQPIDGIVYLHGRLTKPRERAPAPYIISRASFGRAYLAEGWAAQFVRELRERYTVVLVGYRAEDPPVQYLLEGLDARTGAGDRPPLYAFVEGEPSQAWRDRGVTPIAYDRLDEAHSGLWRTLEAWAEASRDAAAWQSRLVSLAQQAPTDLKPFERGQVAHLVRSAAGAKLFADAVPPPPAEWLCVLDAAIRYGEPGRASADWSGPTIDPQDFYRLDDDPPRPDPQPNERLPIPGDDLLGWRSGDPSSPERIRLAGWPATAPAPLPPRLFRLSLWLALVLDQPAAIWWAARAGRLHPEVVRQIGLRLDRDAAALPEPVRRFWRCYIEYAEQGADDDEMRWYALAERLKVEGWTTATRRAFEAAMQPRLAIGAPILRTAVPPAGGWADLSLQGIAGLDVKLGAFGDALSIPSTELAWTVDVMRRALERFTDMLAEIDGALFWRPPTLIPTGEPGESFHEDDLPILAFRDLFVRLKGESPDLARRQLDLFPVDNPLFGKFVMFSVMHADLVPAASAAARLLDLPDAVFWQQDNWRELLQALRARWSDWRDTERRRLEKRLAAGPPPWPGETRTAYRRRRATTALAFLRHLELHGLTLLPATSAKLPALRERATDWEDRWALEADDSLGSRGGMIHEVKQPLGLEHVPLADVVATATALSTEDLRSLQHFRPFSGLVVEHPVHALAALRLHHRCADYPEAFWLSLLSDWPEAAPRRATWLLALTLPRLPARVLWRLRFYAPSWLRRFLPRLAVADLAGALAAFDALLARYSDMPELESSIGETSVGGVVQARSQVSVEKALNSPAGALTNALFDILPEPTRRGALPAWFTGRLEQLLGLRGIGAGHAAALVARRLQWFDFWARRWTHSTFLPLFRPGHRLAEAVWHGLLSSGPSLTGSTWRMLKPSMLAVAASETSWRLDPHQQAILYKSLVSLAIGRGAPLSLSDVEAVLRECSEEARREFARGLADRLRRGASWRNEIRPLIEGAWPKALALQSAETARAFAQVAAAAGDDYPEAVRVVRPFLRPVARLETLAYGLRAEGIALSPVERFPEAVLDLLGATVADDPQQAPWGLGELVERLATAEPQLQQKDAWIRLRRLAG